MKITKPGNLNPKVAIKCICENPRCECEFEVEEIELEGNTSRFCWCPECKETVWVNEREVARAIEVATVASFGNF